MALHQSMVQIYTTQEWVPPSGRHEHSCFSIYWSALPEQCSQSDRAELRDIFVPFAYVALNTWSKAGPSARTFLPAGHQDDQTGTQIDFICSCNKLADGRARQAMPRVTPFVPHTGARHLPISATIPLPNVPHRKGHGRRFNVQECCDKLQKDGRQETFKRLLMQQVNDNVMITSKSLDQVLNYTWEMACKSTAENASEIPLHVANNTPSCTAALGPTSSTSTKTANDQGHRISTMDQSHSITANLQTNSKGTSQESRPSSTKS